MKTAIYIRVSTEEQVKEGYSISAQTQKLKAFCISQGWDVVGMYPDEGISAKDTNRPYLQQMIQDIKDGKIECVLVYRLDRLTRSVFDLYKILEVFETHDCKFKSATEVYDTTSAMGRMFITIVAALAQWERENMGERISFGFAEKARQGKYPLNFAPIGYDLNKKESKLYINLQESKIVKLIFDLYQKMGMNQVAKWLNDRELYTKAGNPWSDNTIMKVLRNPVYYGAIKWLGEIYENAHEKIVSKDFWDNTQALIKQRQGQPPRSVSSRYIFSGKVKCPSCGRTMTGCYTTSTYKGKSKKYMQYRCRHKRHNRCEGSQMVSESKLEKAFMYYLESFNYNEFLNDAVEDAEKKFNKKDDIPDIKALNKQLDKIENRKKKWQYAWTEDIMTYDDFKKRMEEANKEESSIKEKLAVFEFKEVETELINKEEIIAGLKSIKENWILLKEIEKKNLVSSIVKEIHHRHIGNKVLIDSIDFV